MIFCVFSIDFLYFFVVCENDKWTRKLYFYDHLIGFSYFFFFFPPSVVFLERKMANNGEIFSVVDIHEFFAPTLYSDKFFFLLFGLLVFLNGILNNL